MQIARSQINEVGSLRPKVLPQDHGVAAAPVHALAEQPKMGEATNPGVQAASSVQMPSIQPIGNQQIPIHQVPQTPNQQGTSSFAALSTTDEESKKAAAAAVAAKLTASTSSAQMLSSVLSSFVAEEAAKVGFSASVPMFPPDKRPKLEHPSSGADAANVDAGNSSYLTPISNNPVSQSSIQTASLGPPPLPPPPPPLPPTSSHITQYPQSGGMMMNMHYGYSSNTLQLPPPLQSNFAMNLARPPTPQNSQPLQPPQQLIQQQNSSGGFYRPPGIGHYGSSSQPATPPVQRQ